MRRAISLSKALWVGALFASPLQTCNAPIRPLEGSPDRVTSEKRIPDKLQKDFRLLKRVFGLLLFKTPFNFFFLQRH